jgi:hypothetical protein
MIGSDGYTGIMHLARRMREDPKTASKDEALAARITAHFAIGAPWPDNEARIVRFGHATAPPTPYAAPWLLEPEEHWLAHGIGTYFYGLEARGDFAKAGAAALLVTTRGMQLQLGAGGPDRPRGWLLASRGDKHAPHSHLERYQFRFVELTEIGAGDLLLLHFWKLEPLVLRLPWPRSTAALISGLRLLEQHPKALEHDVVNSGAAKIALEEKPGQPSKDIVVAAKRIE